METRKVIHSWDFDGMLSSIAYLEKMKELIIKSADENRALNKNDYKELAQHILQKYKGEFFDPIFKVQNPNQKHVICVGSNRQYRQQDMLDGFLKGWEGADKSCTMSAFPFYTALVDVLNEEYGREITIDKLLLEDINLGLSPGTIFDDEVQAYENLDPEFIKKLAEALKDKNKKGSPTIHEFKKEVQSKRKLPGSLVDLQFDDANKFLLTLTQMGRAAGENEVTYSFRDDKGKLLRDLQEYYVKNPKLIPPKVTLDIDQFLPSDSELRGEDAIGITGGFEKKSLKSTATQADPLPEQTYLALFDQMQTGSYSLPAENFSSIGIKVASVKLKQRIQQQLIDFILEVKTLSPRDLAELSVISNYNNGLNILAIPPFTPKLKPIFDKYSDLVKQIHQEIGAIIGVDEVNEVMEVLLPNDKNIMDYQTISKMDFMVLNCLPGESSQYITSLTTVMLARRIDIEGNDQVTMKRDIEFTTLEKSVSKIKSTFKEKGPPFPTPEWRQLAITIGKLKGNIEVRKFIVGDNNGMIDVDGTIQKCPGLNKRLLDIVNSSTSKEEFSKQFDQAVLEISGLAPNKSELRTALPDLIYKQQQLTIILKKLEDSLDAYNKLGRTTHQKDFARLIEQVKHIQNDSGSNKLGRVMEIIEAAYKKEQNGSLLLRSLFNKNKEDLGEKFANKINSNIHTNHYPRMLGLILQNAEFTTGKTSFHTNFAPEKVMPTQHQSYESLAPIIIDTKSVEDLNQCLSELAGDAKVDTKNLFLLPRDVDNAKKYGMTILPSWRIDMIAGLLSKNVEVISPGLAKFALNEVVRQFKSRNQPDFEVIKQQLLHAREIENISYTHGKSSILSSSEGIDQFISNLNKMSNNLRILFEKDIELRLKHETAHKVGMQPS